MHHKRNRTTRREVKRLDNKAFRQAAKKAMNGRSPQNPPQDRWGYRAPDLPLLAEVCTGPSLGKDKDRPKKSPRHAPCPNGQHEWYEEIIERRDYTLACPHDIDAGYKRHWRRCDCERNYALGKNPYKKVWFTVYTEQKTCIHCWKVRVMRTWDDNSLSWERYSQRFRRSRWGGSVKRKIRTQDPVSGMTVRVR